MEIIIYGAGNQGRAARRVLESQSFCLTAFADKNEEKVAAGEWEDAKVISLEQLRLMEKDTPIIIGIGASRVDLLREIDSMLTDWGFVNIFWSAVEMIEAMFPDFKIKHTFYGFEFSTAVGCKVNCKWCAQQLFTSKYAERLKTQPANLPKDWLISWDTFEKILSKIPVGKVKTIDFSGYSEIFQNPRATDMIIEASRAGFNVAIYTTLCDMTHDDIDRLSKNVRFERVIPHLPDKEGNSKIPVTDEYLSLIVRFFKTFGDSIENFYDGSFVSGVSYHGELHPKVIETLEKEGINILGYDNFSDTKFPMAGHINDDDILSYNHNYPLKCGQIYYWNTKEINKDDNKFFDEKMHMHGICFPNGDVLGCSRSYGYEHLLGNLLQTNYYDLFEGNPAYEKMLANMENPPADFICRTCEFAFDKNQLKLVTRQTHL